VYCLSVAVLSFLNENTIRTVLTIIIWGATGPLFGYSDIWQLVINTGTTFVNGVNELKSMK
jgi:hypothetical protein